MRKIIASLFMVSSLIASAASFAGPKVEFKTTMGSFCLLYTSPSPRDLSTSRMPSSA